MTVDNAKGVKVCVWLGRDGKPVRHRVALMNEATPAEPDAPVFIVSYDENGKIEQADIYYADGSKVITGQGMCVVIVDGKEETLLRK